MHELLVSLTCSGQDNDLRLSLDDGMPAVSLLRALLPFVDRVEGAFTVRVDRSGDVIDPTRPLAGYQLRSGDRLVVSPHEGGWPAPPESDLPSWSMRVESGPRSGSMLLLEPGEIVFGRGQADDMIDLGDRSVSRRHATLTVGDELRIRDLDSRFGTKVNDIAVGSTPVPLANGDRIAMGESVLVVQGPRLVVSLFGSQDSAAPSPAATAASADRLVVDTSSHLSYEDGVLRFNVPPRIVHPEPAVTVELGPAPDTPTKRRFPLASSLVPVFMGAALFFLLNSVIFLAFTAAGPVMAIWTYLDDKQSGRKDFRRRSADYLDEMEQRRAELEAAHAQAVGWRHGQHPGPEAVVDRAVHHSPELWFRRPRHPDFLDVRIGLADQPSLVATRLDDRGDDELIAQTAELADDFGIDPAVPAVIPLGRLGVVGLTGEPVSTGAMARWMATQLITQQSERDLALVVLAPANGPSWEWVKWVPHTARLTSHGRTVATSHGEAATLFEGLKALADRRVHDRRGVGSSAVRFAPHVVVVVEPPLRISAREMAAFVEIAPSVGFSLLWIDEDRSGLPSECGAIIAANGEDSSVVLTDGGHEIGSIRADLFTRSEAVEVARAVAPLRDASGSGEGDELPSRVDLVELYDPEPDSAAAFIERWRSASRRDLSSVVGITADGPLRLDLRADGPHGLVAGTTGAGKSEFLQSLVAGLAIEHPPDHLNFVLIDYKGGAAFKDAEHLPHTVGFVTDLDAHLARRALTSLNAELKRRERALVSSGAKDLLDLIERNPVEAPPSVLIVIDEFAALKSEVPEFVDGVVDIAQRGRSLGVHLLLATQKPGGVITPAIQANTNLRVALRVADTGESTDVIGRPDAADIPRSHPGRGYARTGPTEVRSFQSAYVGGVSKRGAASLGVVHAGMFTAGAASAGPVAADAESGAPTDLEEIVLAAKEAAAVLGLSHPRRPWLPELGALLPWAELSFADRVADQGLSAPVGIVDRPELQIQEPFVLDLSELGHLIVYGGTASGKTTLLRTLTASLAATRPPSDLHVYGLDFASNGLAPIEHLPHCGAVIRSDDLDRVRRLLSQLQRTAAERKVLLGDVGAASLREYQAATGQRLPHILLLVDGFGQFRSLMETLDRGQHLESFIHLVGVGHSVGIHTVLTADRRAAIPPQLTSTIAGRAVLPMANPDELYSLGLPDLAKSPPLNPGRAHFGDAEVQTAVLDLAGDTGGSAQAAALADLGRRLVGHWGPGDVPAIRLLPEKVSLAVLTRPEAASRLVIPLGLGEANLETSTVDLGDNPVFLIAGPDRSGRTNALAVLAEGFAVGAPSAPRYLLGTRRSWLLDREGWTKAALGVDACAEAIPSLADEFDRRAVEGGEGRLLVMIDDAEELADSLVAPAIDRMIRRARDANAVVAFAMPAFRAKGYAPWLQSLRNARHGLLLQPNDDDGEILQLRLPRRTGLALPPGRGYLVHRGAAELVQVAEVSHSDEHLPHAGNRPTLAHERGEIPTTEESAKHE